MNYEQLWLTMINYDKLWATMMNYDELWSMITYDSLWWTRKSNHDNHYVSPMDKLPGSISLEIMLQSNSPCAAKHGG